MNRSTQTAAQLTVFEAQALVESVADVTMPPPGLVVFRGQREATS